MSGLLVAVTLLVAAAISAVVGFLLARTRSAAQLAAMHGQLRDVELAKAGSDTRVATLEEQLRSQRAVRDTDTSLTAMREQLAAVQRQVQDAEKGRAEAHSQLKEQLRNQGELTRTATAEVQLEARKLSRALHRTNVRGMWGESGLRRLVEAAGMLERVHFDTQAQLTSMDERKRPDMIVHLAGDRDIVVDAKVPLDALLADRGEDADAFAPEVLDQHAAALRGHVDTLAARRYTDLLPDSPELVVLFLPAESLLSLALAADAGLLDHAFGKGVALATPTTMLALLRTVQHGWRQEAVAHNAREIHALGEELHSRLGTMSSHFRKLGKSLDQAVGAFNQTVGSYETRVLVQARRFSDLELVTEEIPPTPAIERSPRSLTVAEIDITDGLPLRSVGSTDDPASGTGAAG